MKYWRRASSLIILERCKWFADHWYMKKNNKFEKKNTNIGIEACQNDSRATVKVRSGTNMKEGLVEKCASANACGDERSGEHINKVLSVCYGYILKILYICMRKKKRDEKYSGKIVWQRGNTRVRIVSVPISFSRWLNLTGQIGGGGLTDLLFSNHFFLHLFFFFFSSRPISFYLVFFFSLLHLSSHYYTTLIPIYMGAIPHQITSIACQPWQNWRKSTLLMGFSTPLSCFKKIYF